MAAVDRGDHQQQEHESPEPQRIDPGQRGPRQAQPQPGDLSQKAPPVQLPQRRGGGVAAARGQLVLEAGQRPVLEAAVPLDAVTGSRHGRPAEPQQGAPDEEGRRAEEARQDQ